MNKEEKINLAYEIASKLFGKHAFEPHPVNNAICEICNCECGHNDHLWPFYPEDSAAAMEVLKKCTEECDMPVEIDRKRDKKAGHWRIESGTMSQGLLAIAPAECNTLELAICLFAKKLFSK